MDCNGELTHADLLDGIADASFPIYRFLQRIYHPRGVALFAASRDARSLGALARLFWPITSKRAISTSTNLRDNVWGAISSLLRCVSIRY